MAGPHRGGQQHQRALVASERARLEAAASEECEHDEIVRRVVECREGRRIGERRGLEDSLKKIPVFKTGMLKSGLQDRCFCWILSL